MHVDGAWAEEQLPGDLAVGAPDRDRRSTSTSRRDNPACSSSPAGPSTESTLDLLAEASELLSRSSRKGTGTKPTGGAVDRGQTLDRQPTLPAAANAMAARSSVSARSYGTLTSPRRSRARVNCWAAPAASPSTSANSPRACPSQPPPRRCRALPRSGRGLRRAGDVSREALAREHGRGPAKRRHRIVTLLPVGDATDGPRARCSASSTRPPRTSA